jgi:hypothetical protein
MINSGFGWLLSTQIISPCSWHRGVPGKAFLSSNHYDLIMWCYSSLGIGWILLSSDVNRFNVYIIYLPIQIPYNFINTEKNPQDTDNYYYCQKAAIEISIWIYVKWWKWHRNAHIIDPKCNKNIWKKSEGNNLIHLFGW